MEQRGKQSLSNAAQHDVSRETVERAERYAAQLLRWTGKINLISSSEHEFLWQRHIIDSAQIFPLRKPETKHWADIGSGGGLPGLVNAIIAAELAPDIRFTLVESDKRKAVFLRMIVSEFQLNAAVVAQRAELTTPLDADTLTARAVTSLDRLLGLASRHLVPEGHALFPKGRSVDAEIQGARRHWHYDVLRRASILDPASTILQIDNIRPR